MASFGPLRRPAWKTARRWLGDGVRGPRFTDVEGHLQKAKEFFTKPALSYPEYKQQCESLRLFAFGGVCGGCALSLFLFPPKSSYWATWSPWQWAQYVGICFKTAPALFATEKIETVSCQSILYPQRKVSVTVPPASTAQSSPSKPVAPPKPRVLFVLGGPGAGKGTQCTNICTRFPHWSHISAGDCLRAERNDPQSKDGELINSYIKEGNIVPVEITVRLLEKAMWKDMAQGKTDFLIDGFPRNLDNVTGWEQVIGDRADVLGVLFFEATETEMEKRLLGRSATSGRVDDNLESIRKRFRTFEKETMPIVEKYKKQRMVFTVDGMQTVDEVWSHTLTKLREVEAVAVYGP